MHRSLVLSSRVYNATTISAECWLKENLMFGYLHLLKKSTNCQSKLKSWFWDSFPPLHLYWTLKVSSGYSSSGYLIVSTCDMRKVLENLIIMSTCDTRKVLANLMFGYLHLPKKSTNCQIKLKSWFWDSFPSLYLYWTLKVSSGYSSLGYLIVSTCDRRKVLENLMFGYLHLPKKSTNCQRKLKSWFWDSFPPLYLYWTLKVSSGYSSSGY